MPNYRAPLQDMQFVITELAGLEGLAALPGYEEVTPDLVGAVLEEAAKLAGDVLAPLNQSGDEQGTALTKDGVVAADGFAAAYRRFVENGWNGLGGDPEHGGQGLPGLIAAATVEMWNSANMSFALCPLLTAGATEALKAHGSDELKSRFLPKLVSGEWAGTMNLTEPQAGSDLSAVRTRAVPEAEHYRLFGQKIFITWGDHDMAENVVHLVLARLPDAPEGTRGISLFLVPKFLVGPDGSPAERNDVLCASGYCSGITAHTGIAPPSTSNGRNVHVFAAAVNAVAARSDEVSRTSTLARFSVESVYTVWRVWRTSNRPYTPTTATIKIMMPTRENPSISLVCVFRFRNHPRSPVSMSFSLPLLYVLGGLF